MNRDTNKEIEKGLSVGNEELYEIMLMMWDSSFEYYKAKDIKERKSAIKKRRKAVALANDMLISERKRTLEEVKLTNWELDRLSALVEKEIDNEWEMLAPGMEKAVQVYTDDLQKLLSKLKYKDNGN